MKKIEAIIRPFKLAEVRETLENMGVYGMTISDIQGLGRQKGLVEIYRGAENPIDALPKTKLEILVKDDLVPDIIDAIMKAARTGKIGDGKIWVTNIEQVYRIRTGEQDEEAT